jgi:hypothetical protein
LEKQKRLQTFLGLRERTIKEIKYKINLIQEEYNLSFEEFILLTSCDLSANVEEKIEEPIEPQNNNQEKTEIDTVFKKFCKILNVNKTILTSSSRKEHLVNIRDIMAYSFKLREFTYQEIADILNRKCHSTIMHAVSKTHELIHNDLDKSEHRKTMLDMFKMLNPNIEEYNFIKKEIARNERDILTGDINAEDFIEYTNLKIKKKKNN